jgi:peptide/nickel transport system permease protein
VTTTPEAVRLSPRQVARQRRIMGLKRTWASFRSHRSGLFGLGLLTFFILVAIFAPLLADAESIEVTKATGGVLEPPSSEYLLGTDENGRSIVALLIWGSRISLFVGMLASTSSSSSASPAGRARPC